MTTAMNITETFATEKELDRALAVESAAKKFLDLKKLADDYAVMLATAREELIAEYTDYCINQNEGDVEWGEEMYATAGEFGDLRVTVTPISKKVYDMKALLALALKADPEKENLFKLDDAKAKKLDGADSLFTTVDGGYRVEVKARAV